MPTESQQNEISSAGKCEGNKVKKLKSISCLSIVNGNKAKEKQSKNPTESISNVDEAGVGG